MNSAININITIPMNEVPQNTNVNYHNKIM